MTLTKHCETGLFIGVLERNEITNKKQIREIMPKQGDMFNDKTIIVFDLSTGEGWQMDEFIKMKVVRSNHFEKTYRTTLLIAECGYLKNVHLQDFTKTDLITKHR